MKRIEDLAARGNLFTDKQHGFRKRRSAITAARCLQRQIARALDVDKYVAVASMDLSAAFDVVNIDLLLQRLSAAGLPQDVVGLLGSWFTGREAYVEVEGECLGFYKVKLGTVQGSVLGPVLFNLFIRPLLESSSEPAYADDSYHLATGDNKAGAVDKLQRRVTEVEEWMTGSGLKVNIAKTELTVFHRFDTSAAQIKVKNIIVKSSPVLKVLGILFDNRMQWDKHVEKAINETRRALQGLKIIKKHFTTPELLTLITICYSKLYYGSQVWLLPTLKETLFRALLSQSGQCLKIVDPDLSFINLHKKYLRATPRIFALYQTAINYFEAMNMDVYTDEKMEIVNNTTSDCRNCYFTFVISNNYKIGLNVLSNRLCSISNHITKNSVLTSKETFITFCKINIIQRGLSNI